MDEHDGLAQRFESHRSHLRTVAYRMLGSPSEADDAVQEAWLRLSRSGHPAGSFQAALVHLNTALVERVLSEPEWASRMTDADRRALTPLFWTHVNLYGKFDLDMSTRLDLAGPSPMAREPARSAR